MEPLRRQETRSEMGPKSWNRTAVRSLAGYRADERPISFLVDDREIEIRTIVVSWREPDYLYFRLQTEDGTVYELRHHEYEDFWEMREFGP